MKIKQIFKDKHGNYSAREIICVIAFVWCVVSAAAEQFGGHPVNETVFVTFAGMASAGFLGYSIDTLKTLTQPKPPLTQEVGPPPAPTFIYPTQTLHDVDPDR